MSDLGADEFLAHRRFLFEEGLAQAGYRQRGDVWVGTVEYREGSTEVRIDISAQFPYRPPRVTPTDLDSTAWSWHRERDGALCLVAEDDHEDLWWADPKQFLRHVQGWFESANDDWRDDRTDMDLERYFPLSDDRRLVMYGDLPARDGRLVRLKSLSPHTLELSPNLPPARTRKSKHDRIAYVADLGHLSKPPRSWSDVQQLIGDEVTDTFVRTRADTLILRYQRGDHEGAIVLALEQIQGGIELRHLNSAPTTTEALRARAGRSAAQLSERNVAVIGLGAIGSFAVDLLARAGVKRFTLIDQDIVKPGNLPRHLVGPDSIGLPKTLAVKQLLVKRHGLAGDSIGTLDSTVDNSEEVMTLLRNHDLVVDASADFSVTAMIHHAAARIGCHAISAALQNSGTTARIDVLPPLDGEALPSTAQPNTGDEAYFEAGCGSPISPATPQSVIEAAAIAARHAIGLLTDTPITRAGEARHLTESQQ
ncbi:ThiF family adenylyltransferase [Curtobacterium flaccumfaciens pv. betae]|nr:ThiF family adenylyltransferase [Curtobacterium flaccumfaciens pv. betae]MBT1655960.1 ThiF family adenylyltransferase [Curtobacterium flaccumfaciens pv. betae]